MYMYANIVHLLYVSVSVVHAAMLSSQLALQGVSSEESSQRSHATTQTEVPEKAQEISKSVNLYMYNMYML